MSQYAFGSGTLYGRSTANATATPVQFGTLQDVSLDFSFTTKSLFGQYSFARAIGRATGKITGKASFGQFTASAFNDLFFNSNAVGGLAGAANSSTALTAGSVRVSQDEVQSALAGSITVNHGGANFVNDLGVVLQSSGVALTRVTSNATTAEYQCNETTGVYTVNPGLNNIPLLISYSYKSAIVGTTIPMTNQLIGQAPEFMIVFRETFNGKDATIVFNSCVSNKLSFASKLEDFMIPAFDFEAKADSSNTIGSMSFDE